MLLNYIFKYSDIIKIDRFIIFYFSINKRKDDDYFFVSCYGYVIFFIVVKLRM